ncbi:hypothetical protein KRMM14A1259_18920 [Krasilnikovia sp. MM14-A1259]
MPTLARACLDLSQAATAPFTALVPLDTSFFSGDYAGADTALYEPEWAKYGGQEGVAAAEQLFEISSEIALAAASLDKATDRAALTVLLMQTSVATVQSVHGTRPGSPPPAIYWERHLMWWTRDAGSHAEQLKSSLRKRADAAGNVHSAVRRLAEDPGTTSLLQRWSVNVSAYLDEVRKKAVPKTPGHLIFHQNHMMANRLGILPREEAVLGIVAAGYA